MSEPEPHHHTAYTDGSWNNKLESASWGLAIYQNGKLVYQDCGLVNYEKLPKDARKTRQVAGEAIAAVKALEWAIKNDTKIFIIYDYKGVEYWVTGKWKAKKKLTQYYRDTMRKNQKCIAGWKWVKGHTGNTGNEKADRLAKQAIKEAQDE